MCVIICIEKVKTHAGVSRVVLLHWFLQHHFSCRCRFIPQLLQPVWRAVFKTNLSILFYCASGHLLASHPHVVLSGDLWLETVWSIFHTSDGPKPPPFSPLFLSHLSSSFSPKNHLVTFISSATLWIYDTPFFLCIWCTLSVSEPVQWVYTSSLFLTQNVQTLTPASKTTEVHQMIVIVRCYEWDCSCSFLQSSIKWAHYWTTSVPLPHCLVSRLNWLTLWFVCP